MSGFVAACRPLLGRDLKVPPYRRRRAPNGRRTRAAWRGRRVTGRRFKGPDWYDCGMKVISGTVVDGKIDVPIDALAEGDRVAILAADSTEPIQLTPDQEDEMVAAVEDIRRGRYVDGQDFVGDLRRRTEG